MVRASLPAIRKDSPGGNFLFRRNCVFKIQGNFPFFFSDGLEKSEKNFQRGNAWGKRFFRIGKKNFWDGGEKLFFFFGSETKKIYFGENFLGLKFLKKFF